MFKLLPTVKTFVRSNPHSLPMLLVVYNIAANLSNDIYLPSMSTLTKVFNASAPVIQLTMTVWLLGVALPQFLFGFLATNWNKRFLLLSGGGCFLVGTLSCILATHISVLMVGRFLQGVGVCSLNVSTLSIINERYWGSQKIHWLALINVGTTLSPMLGPVLGGYLFVWFNWQANFGVVFLLALLALWGLSWSLSKNNAPASSILTFKQVVKAYLRLSVNAEFMSNLLLYAAMVAGVIGYLTGSAFVLIKQLHLTPEAYGLLQLWIFGAGALGSLLVIGLASYVQVKKLIGVGLSLVLIASLVLTFNSLFWSDSVRAFIAPMMLYMLGFHLCSSSLLSAIMASADTLHSLAAAYIGFAGASAGVVSSFLVSVLYNDTSVSVAVVLLVIILLTYLVVHMWRKKLLPDV